jgi:hypothetical protein
MAIADYEAHALKGIKESHDLGAKTAMDKYLKIPIFNFENTNEFEETFTSTEGATGSKELSPDETPPDVTLKEGYTVTLKDKRFGGAIVLNEEERAQGRSNQTKVNTYLTRARNAVLRDNLYLLVTNVFGMLNNGFSSSADTLAPDGVELFGTHTWNGGGTFTNAATAALALASVNTMEAYAGAFTMQDGKQRPLSLDTIVVKKGGSASITAKQLFAEKIAPTAIADINIYQGSKTVIEVPYITSATAWFALDNMVKESPLYVGMNQYPTMRAPKELENEGIRTNVTGFYKYGINVMPFNVYGSTGAA